MERTPSMSELNEVMYGQVTSWNKPPPFWIQLQFHCLLSAIFLLFWEGEIYVLLELVS